MAADAPQILLRSPLLLSALVFCASTRRYTPPMRSTSAVPGWKKVLSSTSCTSAVFKNESQVQSISSNPRQLRNLPLIFNILLPKPLPQLLLGIRNVREHKRKHERIHGAGHRTRKQRKPESADDSIDLQRAYDSLGCLFIFYG
ncbi:MAG: hypothetical protein O8C64_14610 [Candidatus Methanoperedens sp.]|nr:hypothetical protein [Candidatus Methanoperedens sp.]